VLRSQPRRRLRSKLPVFRSRHISARAAHPVLTRWRQHLAADPVEEDAIGDAVKRDTEKGGPASAPAHALPTALVAGLVKKAEALLKKHGLNAAPLVDPDHAPTMEETGIDLTYRLLSPSFKGALLTFSWTKRGGVGQFLKQLTGLQPDQVTFYFCKSIYLALPTQVEALLSALGTIQGAKMRAATPEELEIYKLVKDPKSKDRAKQQGREQSDEEDQQERLMLLVTQLQSATPGLDSSDAAAVLEEAKASFEANNIEKKQLKELQDFIAKKGAPGWKQFVENFEQGTSEDAHKNVALEAEVVKLVAQLTEGRYKGQPQVVYSNEGGKNMVIAVLNAPFPFHFRFERVAGGQLKLAGAGAKICENDYVVPAAEAKDLLFAILTLGISAKQAAQVPEEIRERGQRRQELSGDEAAEFERTLEELSGNGKAPTYTGALYLAVLQQAQKLSGKKLSADLLQSATDLLGRGEVSGKDMSTLFQYVATELGVEQAPRGALQALTTAVETAADPNRLSPEAEAALRTLLGLA
jgi:hypothetical protein